MAQRAGVSFEVHRLALEGDELVVSGFWSGVRGLRFVRPADRVKAGGDDVPASGHAPLGVRTPAARTIMPQLRDPRRESKLVPSQFDLWIIRVLGIVAAACFILLLLSILRVFH